jgi:Flp pilus assembly protein TadG
MVETCIVALLALMVIFGITEFGRALFTYHAVSNGARLGSRYAIVHGANCTSAGCPATTDTIKTYVQNSTPGLNQSSLSATATWTGTALDGSTCASGSSEKPGCTVTITVQYPYDFVLPSIFGSRITMSSTSQMVVSN